MNYQNQYIFLILFYIMHWSQYIFAGESMVALIKLHQQCDAIESQELYPSHLTLKNLFRGKQHAYIRFMTGNRETIGFINNPSKYPWIFDHLVESSRINSLSSLIEDMMQDLGLPSKTFTDFDKYKKKFYIENYNSKMAIGFLNYIQEQLKHLWQLIQKERAAKSS